MGSPGGYGAHDHAPFVDPDEPGSLEATDSEDNVFVLIDPGDTPPPIVEGRVVTAVPEPPPPALSPRGAYEDVLQDLAPALAEDPAEPPPPPLLDPGPPPEDPGSASAFHRLPPMAPVRSWSTEAPVFVSPAMRRPGAESGPLEPPIYGTPRRFQERQRRQAARRALRLTAYVVAGAGLLLGAALFGHYLRQRAETIPETPQLVATPEPEAAPEEDSGDATPAMGFAASLPAEPTLEPAAEPTHAATKPGDWRSIVPERLAAKVLGERGIILLQTGEEIMGRFEGVKDAHVILRYPHGTLRVPLREVEDIRRPDGRSVWEDALIQGHEQAAREAAAREKRDKPPPGR